MNISAFDESVLQSAIDAIFCFEGGPAAVRAMSDGFSLSGKRRISESQSLLARRIRETDALIEIWTRAGRSSAWPISRAESRGGLSDGNYLSRFLPTLDGLGPFGLNGHSSERNADGTKVPEYVVVPSFREMGAINVAAICDLMRR